MIGAAAGTAAAAGAVAALGTGWWRARRRARLLAVVRDVTAHHARLLIVKRQQLVVHDGYGNHRLQPWIDHVSYFIERVVLREARARGLAVEDVRPGTARWSSVTRAVLATLAEQGEASGRIVEADVRSGEHYEALCRSLLQARGWRVEATPVTGDQGADLIAEAGGTRVVIQCKFHGRPVGNKAVQEAHAAVGFHAGDRAAVVSNASFTRSAQLLARSNGVLLLHHDQLADLGDMLGKTVGALR